MVIVRGDIDPLREAPFCLCSLIAFIKQLIVRLHFRAAVIRQIIHILERTHGTAVALPCVQEACVRKQQIGKALGCGQDVAIPNAHKRTGVLAEQRNRGKIIGIAQHRD